MSAHTEPHTALRRRPGVALLLAIVTLVVLGVCVMALWHTHAGALRSDRLARAAQRRDAQADSMLATAITAMQAGAWRTLVVPGRTITIARQRVAGAELSASITRLGWQTLLVRGAAVGRSGVQTVSARAEHRVLVPLRPPLPLPSAALTGARLWTVDPLASVVTVPASTAELACRSGGVPDSASTDSATVGLDSAAVVMIDPDTVSVPLRGVFRLIRDRIRRPMVVDGMVESVTGLLLGADLQLAGVLVVQGSVQSAGGRLDVTGAAIARDSGGGRSVLGNGDRVRYDACAIRRAMERLTRPAPAAAWTIVGHF